jgi:hypothetical protein
MALIKTQHPYEFLIRFSVAAEDAGRISGMHNVHLDRVADEHGAVAMEGAGNSTPSDFGALVAMLHEDDLAALAVAVNGA